MKLDIIKNIVFVIYWIWALSVFRDWVIDKEMAKEPLVNKSLNIMREICMGEFYTKNICKLLKYVSIAFAFTEISAVFLETILFLLKSKNKIIKIIALFLKTKIASVIIICLIALIFIILILLICSVLYSCIMYPIFTYLKNLNKNHQKYVFGKMMQRILGVMGIIMGFVILITSARMAGNIINGDTIINIKWLCGQTKEFFFEYISKIPAIVYAIGAIAIFTVNEMAYYQPGWKVAALEFALVLIFYSLTYKSVEGNISLEIWWYKLYVLITIISSVCSSYKYRGKFTEIFNAILAFIFSFFATEGITFCREIFNAIQNNSVKSVYIIAASFAAAYMIIIFYSQFLKMGLECNVSVLEEIELDDKYYNNECNIFDCAINQANDSDKLQYLFQYSTSKMYIGMLESGRWVRYDNTLSVWVGTREAPQFKHKYRVT